MFTRLIGVAAVNKSKKRWDITEERNFYFILAEELKILKNHAHFYVFRRFPFTFWILGCVTLGIAMFLHYFLWYISHPEE